MATGVGFGFDLSFLEKLKDADKLLEQIYNRSNQIKASTIDAFKQMSSKGVVPFVEGLKQQKKLLEEIGNVKVTGKNRMFDNLQKDAAKTVDEINKVLQALQKTKGYRSEASGRSAISFANKTLGARGDKSVDNLRKALSQLEAAQNRQNLNTKRGQKNYENLAKSITKVKTELDKVTGGSNKLLNVVGDLARTLGIAFSVQQIYGFLGKVVQVRREFELQQRSLGIIIRDSQMATEIWNKNVQLALKSPFQVLELTKYTKQLAAYRIESEKLFDTTRRLADISAGLGVDMQRLILAYGQVRAAEFLRGTELRQFTEAGIPMLEELAEYYSKLEGEKVSPRQVFSRISKRQVSFEDVDAVIKKMTDAGGVFYKMQEQQAQTVHGMISNLRDSYDLAMNEIGRSHNSTILSVMKMLKYFAQHWQQIISLAKTFVTAFIGLKVIAPMVTSIISVFKTFKLAVHSTIIDIKKLNVSTNTASSGFGRLGASIKAAGINLKNFVNLVGKGAKSFNWITLAIVAATLLAEKLMFKDVAYESTIQEIEKDFKRFQETIGKLKFDFFDAEEIDEKREKLQEIVELANREYDMNININVGELSEEEIESQFNEIAKKAEEKQNFLRNFQTTVAERDKERGFLGINFVDEFTEDLSEFNAAMTMMEQLYEQRYYYAQQFPQAVTQEWIKSLEEMEHKQDAVWAFYRGLKNTLDVILKDDSVRATQNKVDAHFKQMTDEVDAFFSEIDKYLGDFDEKTKADLLNFAIDNFVSTNAWTDQMRYKLKRMAEEHFGVTLIVTPEAEPEFERFQQLMIDGEDTWKIRLAFDLDEQNEFEPIKQELENALSQENFKGVADETNKTYKDLIEQQELLNYAIKHSTDEIVDGRFTEGQLAYLKKIKPDFDAASPAEYKEALTAELNTINNAIAAIKDFASQYGIKLESGKGGGKTNNLLEERIKILREMHKRYEELNDTFSDTESEKKVLESYNDIFEELLGSIMDINEIDITTPEGLAAALEKVGKNSNLTTKELRKLEKAIAEVNTEIGIDKKKQADEKIKQEIEDLFSQYEVSLQFDDLEVPSELFRFVTGSELLSLEGLRDELMGMEERFIGGDMEDEWKKIMLKYDKLVEDDLKKRGEQIIEFYSKNIDEAVKLLNEKEINISIAQTALAAGAISIKDYSDIIETIVKESNDELSKINLNKFKQSSDYITVMGDMSALSVKELKILEKKLEDIIALNSKTMSVDELKEHRKALENINDAIDNQRNLWRNTPWSNLSELSNLQKQYDEQKNLLETEQDRKKNYENMLSVAENAYDLFSKSGDKSSAAQEAQKIVDLKGNIAQTDNSINNITSNMSNISDKMGAITGGASAAMTMIDLIIRGIYQAIKATIELFNEIKDLADSFGTDVETGTWLEATNAFDIINEMNENVMNAWERLKSGDGLGSTVASIAVILDLIKGINKALDSKKSDEIKKLSESVEELQKKYEDLDKTLEKAYDISRLQDYAAASRRYAEDIIRSYDEMIALEKSKKNTDDDELKKMEDEREEQLYDLEQRLRDIFSEVTGGVLDDSKTAADDFVNAWLESFAEVGDGIGGIEDSFDEMLATIIKKQMALSIVSPYMEKWKQQLEKYIDEEKGDLTLSREEALELRRLMESDSQNLSESMENYYNTFKDVANLLGDTGGELAGLQKGIEGITETQAEEITAYLNSLRYYVAENNHSVTELAQNILSNDDAVNPMLSQLRIIATQTTAINDLLNSLTAPHPTLSGRGLKVVI